MYKYKNAYVLNRTHTRKCNPIDDCQRRPLESECGVGHWRWQTVVALHHFHLNFRSTQQPMMMGVSSCSVENWFIFSHVNAFWLLRVVVWGLTPFGCSVYLCVKIERVYGRVLVTVFMRILQRYILLCGFVDWLEMCGWSVGDINSADNIFFCTPRYCALFKIVLFLNKKNLKVVAKYAFRFIHSSWVWEAGW